MMNDFEKRANFEVLAEIQEILDELGEGHPISKTLQGGLDLVEFNLRTGSDATVEFYINEYHNNFFAKKDKELNLV